MITQQTQIKLNLPIALKEYLESKASKFGMPLAGYIKHLILSDVADIEYPTFQASQKVEEAYKKAQKDEKARKLISVGDLESFFEKL